MKGSLLKNKIFRKYFFVLPLVLFTVFLAVFICNTLLLIWINNNQVQNIHLSQKAEFKLPIIKTQFVPQISAAAAIIMDGDSKVVLYSKNSRLRSSTASTTKIMTALTAVDYFKPEDILTVKTATREGSIIGLVQNEQLSFENLLYSMFLPSANDAALAVAQNFPGGEALFVEKMNEKTKALNLNDTHYGDPAGLYDAEDYTTPFDLARLASFAVENPLIKKIVATREKIITDKTGTFVYDLKNLNELLGKNGVNGVKTGYTDEAGQVLVTSKLEKGKTIIIVVMGSEDRFLDTQKLLDLVDNNLTYLSIHP